MPVTIENIITVAGGKKCRGTGEGREGFSFARTFYPHLARFVDKPRTTSYTVLKIIFAIELRV